MAVRKCYNSWHISLPSSAKQQHEMTKFCFAWKTQTPWLFFLIFNSNLPMCPRLSFVIALTEINKVNGFRVSRDSQVQFQSTLSSSSPSRFLKLPNNENNRVVES